MSVDVERLQVLRRRAGRARGADLGVRPRYDVGTYVWARFGQTQGILLARVLSPHPMPHNSAIGGVRDRFEVICFRLDIGRWNERPTFRGILRALIPSELAELRAAGVIS